MPKKSDSGAGILSFDSAPPVVLVAGAVGFFVEEAADRASDALASGGAEVLRFEDDDPPEAITDALLNRPLFTGQRVVRLDASRLIGTESPGDLLEQAIEAWERGTPASRREAFRHTRAALAALGIDPREGAEEAADRAARKVRKGALSDGLAAILRELPEARAGAAAITDALRLLLSHGNDGTVALLTATAPPAGGALLSEIEEKGLVLRAEGAEKRKDNVGLLRQLAESRARAREVTLAAEAVTRLMDRTDHDPALFAAELEKLLEWAGAGGRVRGEDVAAQIEDESSSDLYALFDAMGRRDAGDSLTRLERLLSGARVRAGDREVDTDDYWEVRLFGMIHDEVRKMLLVRSWMEAQKTPAVSSPREFESRVYPRMQQAVSTAGRPLFPGKSYYMWFKVAERASRFTVAELAAAVSRSADVDVALKNSSPPNEVMAGWMGRLLRPGARPSTVNR